MSHIINQLRKNGVMYYCIKYFVGRPFHLLKYAYYLFWELVDKDAITVSACISPSRGYYKFTNNNWGDDVSLIIAALVSKRRIIPYQYSLFSRYGKKKNYLCIGSIIPWLIHKRSIVWGSGIGVSSLEMELKPLEIFSVRGPLTREYFRKKGLDCPAVYGDPALLFPLFYSPVMKKKYKIGIILHYNDCIERNYKILSEYSKEDVCLISLDSYNNWKYFIDAVCSCDFILSTSLHGVIIADTYSVPNIWCEFTYRVEENGLKFRDYYLSVGKEFTEPVLKVDHYISINSLLEYKKVWTANRIDLNAILSACPFRKKN